MEDREIHDIEIPADLMVTLIPGLERLVTENRISMDTANQIILSRKVPLELARHLGFLAHSGSNQFDLFASYQQHQQQSQSVSPIIGFVGNKFCGGSGIGGSNTPNLGGHLSGTASPNFAGHFSGSSATNSQNIPGFNPFSGGSGVNTIGTNSPCSILAGIGCGGGGSGGPSFSGSSSPNTYYGTGGTSPMHQITKGISGLTTGGGSITRGTSAVCDTSGINNQPLDLSMDVGSVYSNEQPQQTGTYSAAGWYVPAQFYDLKPLNLSPAQQVRVVPTPPASPNLCIIQEEILNAQQQSHTSSCNATTDITSSTLIVNTNEDANFPHSHPQICLTDVQGSEITLVALSDAASSSRDSDDSLEGHSSITLQGLIITEQPNNDMPSIMKGVGRKSSLEIEHIKQQEHYERRGSDKSLGFSDDSLSNDSNILSPSQEPSASSGFKSGGDSHSDTCCDHTESRLSPDSLSESRCISSSAAGPDEYYEVPLPHECSNLDSTRILEMVKQTIDSKMPPKGFILHKVLNDPTAPEQACGIGGSGGPICVTTSSSSSSTNDMQLPGSMDISNLSLEYSGGLQIELQVCDGRSKNNSASKGIKLRRISGDQFEYGKLCQQLISSLTV